MNIKESLQRIGYVKLGVVLLLIGTIVGLSLLSPAEKDDPRTSLSAAQDVDTSDATIYMTPSAAGQAAGSSFQVKLQTNSGADAVNVAQMQVKYPADKLKLDRIAEDTAFPIVAATDTATPGLVRLARTVPVGSGGISGKQTVATLHFTVLPAASGAAVITYDTEGSLIMKASDNTNIVQKTAGTTVTVQ